MPDALPAGDADSNHPNFFQRKPICHGSAPKVGGRALAFICSPRLST